MTLKLTPTTPEASAIRPPRITVIGVGGGGGNAVDNMISTDLKTVEFIVANTDAQQLNNSRAKIRLQLGPALTRGLGAGAKPEIGRQSAEEVQEELRQHLTGVDLVFITAGMGGGTGTGAAPVIARIARENGALTIGVVSKPFQFEGVRRGRAAEAGIAELQKHVDTLIVIPNQNLFSRATQTTSLIEAFKMADDVLHRGVRSITDLMVIPGRINLDFADVKTVMSEMGKAMIGTGISEHDEEGQDWATLAAERAISNPLLEETSIKGARGLLVNVTGGPDLGLHDYTQIMERIGEEAHPDAEIISGLLVRDDMEGKVQISVVATGISPRQGKDMEGYTSFADDDSYATAGQGEPKLSAGQDASTTPQSEESMVQANTTQAGHSGSTVPNYYTNPRQTPMSQQEQSTPAQGRSPAYPSSRPQAGSSYHEDSDGQGGGLFSRFFRSRPSTPEPRPAPYMHQEQPRTAQPQRQASQKHTQRPQQDYPTPSEPHSPQQQAPDLKEGPDTRSEPVQHPDANLDIPAYLRRKS